MKLLILDVDGVLTDGTKLYDAQGRCSGKRFGDRDFTAMKMFRAQGVEVVWLSGDEWNRTLAGQRRIPFYSSKHPDGKLDKVAAARTILAEHGLADWSQVGFVGDDYFDMDLMVAMARAQPPSPYLFCPADAVPGMDAVAQRLTTPGGRGVAVELYHRMGFPPVDWNRVLELDSDEHVGR